MPRFRYRGNQVATNVAGATWLPGQEKYVNDDLAYLLRSSPDVWFEVPDRAALVQRTPGGIWCDWQPSGGTLSKISADAGDAFALDTGKTLDGFLMAKCTFSNAASGTFIGQFAFTNPVSLKGYTTIQIPVEITNCESASGVGQSAAPFQVWLYPSGGGTIRLLCEFQHIPPNGRHVFTFGRESPAGLVTFTGTTAASWSILDTETISQVRIVQGSVTASASYPVWVGPLRCDARAAIGAVSLVMDGVYSSQFSIFKPLLEKYGLKASLAITIADIGGAGRMSLPQINSFMSGPHEAMLHTFDSTKVNGYANASDWSTAAAIMNDVRSGFGYFKTRHAAGDGEGWIRGLGKAVNAFSNPFDTTVTSTRQRLVFDALRAAGVECSRASTNLYTAQMCLGYKGVTPFHIRGALQVTNTHGSADLIAKFDQAEANGEWCVITFHRGVDSNPGSLEMTVANLDATFAYLAGRIGAGRLWNGLFSEVFDTYFR